MTRCCLVVLVLSLSLGCDRPPLDADFAADADFALSDAGATRELRGLRPCAELPPDCVLQPRVCSWDAERGVWISVATCGDVANECIDRCF